MDLKYFGYTEFMNRFGKREISRFGQTDTYSLFQYCVFKRISKDICVEYSFVMERNQ